MIVVSVICDIIGDEYGLSEYEFVNVNVETE
jgi:hypothetical protein